MRNTSAARVLLGLILTITISPSYSSESNTRNEKSNSQAAAKELGVEIEHNVPVKMRDGTILRADVHRPDRGGPYPVLVQQTPYGKKGDFQAFVKAGYIVVSQDIRGRGGSEGTHKSYFTPRESTHDAEDGYDTVEWAARLPNSNGKVGTFSVSMGAYIQWRLAPLRPPSLLAMSACSIMAHFDNEHGAFRPLFLAFTNEFSPEMRRRANRPGVHSKGEALRLWNEGESEKWLNWLPWLELPRDIFEDETEAVHCWMNNPHIDPWRHDEGCSEIEIPNLDILGWYDYANGNMLLYKTMVKEAKSEIARKGSRLIVGPWTHLQIGRRRIGDMDFGNSAELDITALRIHWFDYWLKGIHNDADKDSKVKIFVMGDNKWRDEEHWPLKRAQEKTLFITSNGHANNLNSGAMLIAEKPQSFGRDTYDYDPKDPVPTLGRIAGQVITRTASDQRPLAERSDILTYQTEPLTERVEVTGFPVVELYAATSAPDTDWFVRLIDVYPSGFALDVSQGVVRARYRNGIDKPELVEPGEVVAYTIRMKPTSNAFSPGHRIRLDITSSDFPNYDRNHNTAADQHVDPTLVVAKQTVFHGGLQATRIILPSVPNPKEVGGKEERDRPRAQQQEYPLHQAAAAGDTEQIRRLISEGIDINLQDGEKNTPLCHAVKAGNMEATHLIIKEGADVNAGLPPPLSIAVKADNIVLAKHLIAHGASINLPKSWTPFQEALYSGSIEMAELLIDEGADVKTGKLTVWQQAIIAGRTDMIGLLLKKGIDPNAKDQYGTSFLGFAFRYGSNDVVELLLTRGAESIGIVGQFQKDKAGPAVLHKAAMYGHKTIAKLLLKNGAKVDERDDLYEFTALHYAARFGNKDVAEVLIANNADIRAKDKWDYQPIHWAAYHDRPDVAEILISKGADINAKTALGQTPLQLAQERRNAAIIELLRKHGAKE